MQSKRIIKSNRKIRSCSREIREGPHCFTQPALLLKIYSSALKLSHSPTLTLSHSPLSYSPAPPLFWSLTHISLLTKRIPTHPLSNSPPILSIFLRSKYHSNPTQLSNTTPPTRTYKYIHTHLHFQN